MMHRVVILFLLMIAVSSSDIATTTTSLSVVDHDHHREVQTNTILNAACNFISRILPGDVICDCAITLGFIFVCAFENQICLGPEQTGYCSVPTLQGDVRLLRRTIAIEFCLEDATNSGTPAPGLCFNIGGILNDDDTASFNVAEQSQQAVVTVATPLLKKAANSKFVSLLKSLPSRSSSSSKQPQQQQQSPSKLVDCVGMSDDKNHPMECYSCSLCNTPSNKTGYIFDCSNIHSSYIQSTCTELSFFTNLRDTNQTIQFMPKFD